MARLSLRFLLLSILCALLGFIYELFGHGVYSAYMVYAFAIPLCGGALPTLLLSLRGKRCFPSAVSRMLWHLGIATLTVGSFVRGALDIYGTTNARLPCYALAGLLLLLAAICLWKR